MRVFVLNTGRCGSTTFIKACHHLATFTAGHETNCQRYGPARLDYPNWHIEADNRLSWMLGSLEHRYTDDVAWVHLRRDREAVARSFLNRWESEFRSNIIRAFAHGIIMRDVAYTADERIDVCRYYVDTVTANIETFLAQRPHLSVQLEEVDRDFPIFLDAIGAKGDVEAAMAEWRTNHGASKPTSGSILTRLRAGARRAGRARSHRGT